MTSQFTNDSIFWIEIEKIKPNPYQPRREFDDARLHDLSESIRMYGILQPLVVTRKEIQKPDGGLAVEYELISGERRLRASKLAGLSQVPTLIRKGEDSAREKLELAIIENLQREDLNPVDRARSFERLANEFGLKHGQIADKVGKSREYVSNTMRILALPPEILDALGEGKISEGHTRPLLMLTDRKDEQMTLFKEVMYKKLTVRETEMIARKVAIDKVRKKDKSLNPELIEMEEKFKESLGTRVHIETRENGGKLTIDFFSPDDLRTLLGIVTKGSHDQSVGVNGGKAPDMLERHINKNKIANTVQAPVTGSVPISENQNTQNASVDSSASVVLETTNNIPVDESIDAPIDDRSKNEIKVADNTESTEDLYSLKNFSI